MRLFIVTVVKPVGIHESSAFIDTIDVPTYVDHHEEGKFLAEPSLVL